jgi:prophage maintenance system killer protein
MLGSLYVEYIHDELLDVFWPSSEKIAAEGLRDRSLLESAVARPFHSAFARDAYPTVLDKGIALFHSLISNHAFADGNKRTAVTAFDHFLLANGFVLGLPNQDMYTLATQTASYRERKLSHESSFEALGTALADFITPISTFKREVEGISGLQGSFKATMDLRIWIRRHRFNRLIKPE